MRTLQVLLLAVTFAAAAGPAAALETKDMPSARGAGQILAGQSADLVYDNSRGAAGSAAVSGNASGVSLETPPQRRVGGPPPNNLGEPTSPFVNHDHGTTAQRRQSFNWLGAAQIAGGALAGAAAGFLLGGPLGAIIGAVAGGLLGWLGPKLVGLR